MSVIASNSRNIKTQDRYIHRFSVGFDGVQKDIEFESPLDIFPETFDVALPVVLFPAMKAGRNVVLKGAVSEKLLSHAETIQNIFHAWYKEYALISIACDEICREDRQKGGVACFFTAGVDSSYTLLKKFDEITHLIYVDGFYDFRKGNESITEAHLEHLRKYSEKICKPLFEVRTNLRSFMDRYGIWGNHNHGAGLASIGLLLSKYFQTIYIPSSHTYDELMKWGSHPLLDPLWSTESLQFVHHGCEASRVEKVAEISKNDMILNSLRVCFGAFPNCGRCEKCVRTMINIKIAGALERCTAFLTTETLNPDYVSRLYVNKRDESTRTFFIDNMKALREQKIDDELAEALYDALKGTYRKIIRGFPRRVWNFFRRNIIVKLKRLRATNR